MDAIALLAIFLVGLIPGLYLVAQNSALGSLRNRARQAWGDIDAELKRRHDLVPRFVEIARGDAAQEHEILDRVTAARERCIGNRGPVSSQVASEKELVSSLGALLASGQASPGLKDDAQFQILHGELIETEKRIQNGSATFNALARAYRHKCESFPSSIIARIFGFQPISFFEVESAAEGASG